MFRPLTALLFIAPTLAVAQAPSITTGLAETINPGLIDCGETSRVSAVGEITADDGTSWTVPAATNFETAPHASDLYNDCGGVANGSLAELDLETVPVSDAGGSEVFTAYIFADNYFELYVNGNLVAVDAVPFTPFNSSVVRFSADRPLTLAVLGVDWEENLGLGSEAGRGVPFSPGDAGIVMQLRDANGTPIAVTDTSWQAQTYYISPLSDVDCLVIDGSTRDSSGCSTEGARSADGLSAAHWPLPDGWYLPDFDASDWPAALAYSNDTVGVDNKPGFTNFPDVFDDPAMDAEFIWSSNLILDNLTLLRGTVE